MAQSQGKAPPVASLHSPRGKVQMEGAYDPNAGTTAVCIGYRLQRDGGEASGARVLFARRRQRAPGAGGLVVLQHSSVHVLSG